MLLHVLMQSGSLRSEHKNGGEMEIDGGVQPVDAFVESIDPEALFLQLLESAADVCDANHRQMLQSAGSGSGCGLGKGRGAALRDDDGRCAGGMGRSDNRAEVVRIFDAIEHHQQLRAGGGMVQFRVLLSGPDGDDALMRNAFGEAVKRLPRFEADWNSGRPAEIDDFLNFCAGCTLGDAHPFKRPIGA